MFKSELCEAYSGEMLADLVGYIRCSDLPLLSRTQLFECRQLARRHGRATVSLRRRAWRASLARRGLVFPERGHSGCLARDRMHLLWGHYPFNECVSRIRKRALVCRCVTLKLRFFED